MQVQSQQLAYPICHTTKETCLSNMKIYARRAEVVFSRPVNWKFMFLCAKDVSCFCSRSFSMVALERQPASGQPGLTAVQIDRLESLTQYTWGQV